MAGGGQELEVSPRTTAGPDQYESRDCIAAHLVSTSCCCNTEHTGGFLLQISRKILHDYSILELTV